MIEFTSKDSFDFAISEVEYLINEAINNSQERDAYLTYNKASLLLLASKFENFVENVIEEYINKLNEAALPYSKIPSAIKMNHMKFVLSKSDAIIKHAHKQMEREDIYFSFSKMWISTECCANLSVDNKFNYGKHGPNELVKLFSNIGIDNIFEYIKIVEKQESILGESLIIIDFKSEFSAFVNYRNQIIHQDFTPTLTHNDISTYKSHFVQFANSLVSKLSDELNQIVNALDDIEVFS